MSRNAFLHGATERIHLCFMAPALFGRFPRLADDRDIQRDQHADSKLRPLLSLGFPAAIAPVDHQRLIRPAR